MRFDPSGLYSAFDRMRENAAARGKDLATIQAKDFLNETKKAGREIAPTPQELVDVAKKSGWRLKRKPGTTPGQELQRRIRAIGTFARGWKIARVDNQKFRIRIWLEDLANQSGMVDDKRGVSRKAQKASGGRFKTRLDKLATSITSKF